MADPVHPVWIALAVAGPALALEASMPVERLRVVRDPADFTSLLGSGRPRLAIIASPPAGADDLAVALQERRRRSTLRLIHLSPLDAVDQRVTALRLGFDE